MKLNVKNIFKGKKEEVLEYPWYKFYDEDKRIYLDSSVLSPEEMVAQVLEKIK